jgi:adenylate cyclase
VRLLEAEVHRLKGELLLIDLPSPAEAVGPASLAAAEACFRHAIEVARRQGARWWELRATASLCRLLCKAGAGRTASGAEARRMLADITGTFDEGFDTADLREAQELLETL